MVYNRERWSSNPEPDPRPRGPRLARNVGGAQGTERSTPTGWTRREGTILATELEFSNGYKVLAVQVEGQKAIIKGPDAWAGVLDAIKNGEFPGVVDEWLEHVMQQHPTPKPQESTEDEAHQAARKARGESSPHNGGSHETPEQKELARLRNEMQELRDLLDRATAPKQATPKKETA